CGCRSLSPRRRHRPVERAGLAGAGRRDHRSRPQRRRRGVAACGTAAAARLRSPLQSRHGAGGRRSSRRGSAVSHPLPEGGAARPLRARFPSSGGGAGKGAAVKGLAAVAIGLTIACGGGVPARQEVASGALRGANVLLVTIDTLRADRVGAYGAASGATPTLDRLAGEGWRFETAYAHVPLTLPSHVTLLTGAYPFVNGVRDNGSFRFGGDRPTLATALQAAGYRTGAFVASFVLDARFGLNAGFDVYDDKYGSRPAGGALTVTERPADKVLDAAVHWIAAPGDGATSSQPWFTWVHLYDPHEPYDPPEPYRSRYAA